MTDPIKLSESEKNAISELGERGVWLVALKRAGKVITPPDELCAIVDFTKEAQQRKQIEGKAK